MQLSNTKNMKYQCRFTLAASDAECHRLSIFEREVNEILFKIISKQAQLILNVDNLNAISELSLKTEQQSEYAKQIDEINEEKRRLYEQFVLRGIDADEYKASKAILDGELLRLTQFHDTVSKETAKLAETKSAENETKKIAETVSMEKTLTSSIVDLLIERVLVYPGNKIEIKWKFADFFSDVMKK
jgi:hypothetical protein